MRVDVLSGRDEKLRQYLVPGQCDELDISPDADQ